MCAHLQGGHGGLHHVGQVLADGLHVSGVQVVVGGVLQEPPVEERPSEVVYCVLLGRYRASHDLRIEMIRHLLQQQRYTISPFILFFSFLFNFQKPYFNAC